MTNTVIKNTITDLTPAPASKHVIFIIDVSGSMYGPLTQIRKEIKDMILNRLNPKDLLSVIWFSGRGQFGSVLQSVGMNNLMDFQTITNNLERWLQPIGLTGFKEPLELAAQIASQSKVPVSLTFMSDGQDNQSKSFDIYDAAKKVAQHIVAAEVIEYGNYADRKMLSEIASILSGERKKVNSPSEYGEALNATLGFVPEKQVQVDTKDPHLMQAAIITSKRKLINVIPENGVVSAPEDFEKILVMGAIPELGGKQPNEDTQDILYAHLLGALSSFSASKVDNVLRELGDIYLSNKSATLFGKQKYEEFENEVHKQFEDTSLRYKEGFGHVLPAKDAVTLLDVLNALDDGETKLLINHPNFTYQKISRPRHTRSVEEEQKQIVEKYSGDPEKLSEALKDFTTRVGANATILKSNRSWDEGYTIRELITHKDRANLSLRVKIPIRVELGSNCPENIPSIFETSLNRNFNVVFGGVVTLECLPVILGDSAYNTLMEKKVLAPDHVKGAVTLLDLTKFPLSNRSQVENVSAEELASLSLQIQTSLASLKVLKDYWKDNFPSQTSKGMIEKYGTEGANYLRVVGITDHGFNPPRVSDEGTDAITVTELLYQIKGLVKLPTIDAVKKKIASGKSLTLSEKVIGEALTHLESLLEGASNPKKVLGTEIAKYETTIKSLRNEVEKIRFAVLLGGGWFHDLPEGSNQIELDYKGIPVTATIDTREVEMMI